MNKKITEKEIKKQAKEAREWALSDQGQTALKKVIAYTEKVAEELEEASKIRPESLSKPFGL